MTSQSSLARLFAGWVTTLVFIQVASAAEPVEVGLHKQLLVDDYVIAETSHVARELGSPVKANGGKPLEFSRVAKGGRKDAVDVWPLFASVYFDEQRQRFRIWHRVSFHDRSRRDGKNVTDEEIGVGADYHRGYSESSDGIHFTYVAPLKGLTTGGDTNLVVTIDHHADPNRRYKIGYDCDCKVNGAALAHSADGIHWTPYNDGKPITYRAADFTNQVVWDTAANAYRLFTRTDFGWGGGPLAGAVHIQVGDKPLEVRGVRSMVNPNLEDNPSGWKLEHHWVLDGEEKLSKSRRPIQELLKDPDYLERVRKQALRRQIYVLTDWIYEGVHFGLMSVLEYPTDVSEGTKTDHITRHERSIENYYIVTSRDGIAWDFHWIYAGQPFVCRGPARSWDKDMVFPTSQLITHQDKHWIYYGGNNERHGAAEKGCLVCTSGRHRSGLAAPRWFRRFSER
ncbi:MAG: hypothetical protein CMJ64_04560 [Planctomycetaceae bacterium]|nr:hypothetical protein [Planctomycetaceae bacterium]